MDIDERWTNAQGGVLPVRALKQWGNTDEDIRRAIARDEWRRVRRGWIAAPGADEEVVAAVTAGGCVSCVGALRRRGAWTIDHSLHVRRPEGSPWPLPPGAHQCPLPHMRKAPVQAVDPLPVALVCASRCATAEDFLVLLDSVVNLHLMGAEEVEALFRDAPIRIQRTVRAMAPAESGTETLVRHRLRNRGLRVRSQVVIPGVGRVDLLVGESLVIEVDSVAHHTSLANYRADRERDRRLVSAGYTVVRLTYQQVLFEWSAVEPDILAIHRRLSHRHRSA